MANVSLTTAGVLNVVEWPTPHESESLPNGNGTNTLAALTPVRKDTNGAWIPALATAASNGAGVRILLKTITPGQTGTAIRSGLLGGLNLASQAIGATLFLSDTSTVADAAGTVSITLGRVAAGTANQLTDARDKLFQVDCPI